LMLYVLPVGVFDRLLLYVSNVQSASRSDRSIVVVFVYICAVGVTD
jgi:hypothetical protein